MAVYTEEAFHQPDGSLKYRIDIGDGASVSFSDPRIAEIMVYVLGRFFPTKNLTQILGFVAGALEALAEPDEPTPMKES